MNIREYIPLNFAIMANGYNWVVLTLMVVLAGMMLSTMFPAIEAENAQ